MTDAFDLRSTAPPAEVPTIAPSDATSYCDLVMKGGITSGIIYPKLVAELAGSYRFKNIGGTSAGAIAAAACAAAEHGRWAGRADSFDELARLPAELSEKTGGHSRLFALFQPTPALAGHFATLTGALNASPGQAARRVVFGICRHQGRTILLGMLAVALLLSPLIHALIPQAAGLATALGILSLLCAAALGVLATLGVAVAGFSTSLLRGLHANGYGLCSGRTARPDGPAGLTDWLTDYFDRLAGVDGPLTFGDLWGTADAEAPRRVNLEVVTSAVSQQMIYGIPFRPGAPTFYYDPDEWAGLFPPKVMEKLASDSALDGADASAAVLTPAGKRLRALPKPADLPVAVAVRLSLSFPVLLAAVPLYAVDRSRHCNRADGAGNTPAALTATRVWFSDGGIGSNLPLHMFDALLPGHPTFAVNLKPAHPDFPIEEPERADNAGGRVYLPTNNRGGHMRYWPDPDDGRPLTGLLGFMASIVGTMQNWRDEIAFPYPGYRDRIVQISQKPHEGGLNLDMPQATIEALSEAGAMAARRLIDRFHSQGSEQGAGWTNHQSVRLTTFLGVFQSGCGALHGTLAGGTWQQLLHDSGRYQQDEEAVGLAFLEEIAKLGETAQDVPLRAKAYKPLAEIRITPRV